MEATKIDEYTLEVTREKVNVTTHTYDINFLLEQKVTIQKSLDDYTAARLADLEEVDELLAQCETLGIKAAPIKVDGDKI